MKTSSTDVGVIVGRFQVNRIHEAHRDLIETVMDNHKKVIIILGVSPAKTTMNNPLDFEARKLMIEQEYQTSEGRSRILILPISDTRSDADWSKKLDNIIGEVIGPSQTVTLYGSRDSFISHYNGRFNTKELISTDFVSGTQIREEVKNTCQNSEPFRAGVIWATYNQYGRSIPAVDVAIVTREDKPRLLLVRKPSETKYRFCGGFSEPNSPSFEDDAKREVHEETGVEIGSLEYIGSHLVDDWRYRGEKNEKIKTLFYLGEFIFGAIPRAADDVSEVKWFSLNEVNKNHMVEEHLPLLDMLFKYIGKKSL